MTIYTLNLVGADGAQERLFYDPHASTLRYQNGLDVIPPDPEGRDWRPALPVSPTAPGTKARAPRRIKIQLGLGCNYSCSYCLQRETKDTAAVTGVADVQAFLDLLDATLDVSEVRQVELWGGEPLAYWRKLELLMPALRERVPAARFVMVTNGALLDMEKARALAGWNVSIAMSHDGPGQQLRGPDPFDEPGVLSAVRWLLERRGENFSINAVLSPVSHDLAALRTWFARRLGTEAFTLNIEGVLRAYDDASARGAGAWPDDAYLSLHIKTLEAFIEGGALKVPAVQQKVQDFIDSLRFQRPAASLWQSCSMDRDDQIAVDLLGNVLTCQNVGADSAHNIGHLRDLGAVRLNTAQHWSWREECQSCPVVQLCKGACMYLEGEAFAQTCETEFRWNNVILAGALYILTGKILVSVAGPVKRPARKRIIPIAAATTEGARQ